MKLEDIKKPIEQELADFEVHFRESMRSKVPLLDKIMYYIVQRKGKQMRPMFVFFSAKLCGESNQATYVAASLVELLHTASLVHDDVVDDSTERRGFFSINALWKNKIAVLVGDYLLSQGLLLALKNDETYILQLMSDAVRAMTEGELLQLEKARRLDIEESIYFEIIRCKTASMIAAACATGAASVTKDPELIEKMRLLGEKIGIAFQIRDDLFDFGSDEIGKPLGIDIKERKMTLPLIYALNTTTKAERNRIISIIKRHSDKPERVAEVIQFVRQSEGLNHAEMVMNQYLEAAFEILNTFPNSNVKTSFQQLINYVTKRAF
jgi:octaprenyl-diphosphate synthase